MPLIPTTIETLKADLARAPVDDVFLILSGTEDANGQSWCHYCNLARPDIERVFSSDDKCECNAFPVTVLTEDTLVLKVVRGELLSESMFWLASSLQVRGVPSIYRFARGGQPVAGWEDHPFQPHWEPASYRASDFGAYLDWWAAGVSEFEDFLLSSSSEPYVPPEQRVEALAQEWDEMKTIIAARKAKQEKDDAWRREKAEKAAKRKAREQRRASELAKAAEVNRPALAKLDPNVYGRQQVRAAALRRLRPTKGRLQYIKSVQRENTKVFCDGEVCVPTAA
ncbi:hypothetical protein A1Q2_04540 [Trichosporon asahii var. asahii CBS 8904]|uniref:Thioredoxin domain-containing protein n=1 Tax=Trichosporon asahii var. asahii (strain CBS 8904) TaxID=1220162 RepID=K1VP42_TRIAC|nr:hypothetical protein A1Q2_04540 [Trichosporon asahii var. asahii CBS 8904]